MQNIKENAVIALIVLLVLTTAMTISGFIVNGGSQNIGEESFGKVHYQPGIIGSVTTSATDSTLVVPNNAGRQNVVITNTGDEVVYLWRRDYEDVTEANLEVEIEAGIPIYPMGSYENWDNEFLWIGDLWVSTTTNPVIITFDEK